MKIKNIKRKGLVTFCAVAAAGSVLFAGCGAGSLEISEGTGVRDGVTVTLNKASAQKMTDPDRYEYSFEGTIENNSDEGIMKVIYGFHLYDENGEEFRSFAEIYDGEDKALAPHTGTSFSHSGIKWGPQSVPASVSIDIGSVYTESELPPVQPLREGELLYKVLGDEKLEKIKENPPEQLSLHIDRFGYGRTATLKKGEGLERAVELFCNIKIGKETGEWVTDNYNSIGFTWDDSSTSYISLNLYNLEYYTNSRQRIYELENLHEFIAYVSPYLEEDSEVTGGS